MNLNKLVVAVVGPGLFSSANLLLSVFVLYFFSTVEFGFFAFFQVLIALTASFISSTIGTPLSILRNKHGLRVSKLYSFVAFSLLLSLTCSLLVLGILLGLSEQLDLAVYAGVAAFFSCLRNISRFYHLANHRSKKVSFIDSVYSVLVLLGLACAFLFEMNTYSLVFAIVTVSHAVSFLLAGKVFFLWLLRGCSRFDFTQLKGYLSKYGIWPTLGVISTEAAVNSHSYVVTALLGSAAFAPVAMAMLLYRPVLVLINALIQIERPALAKLFRNNDFIHINKKLKYFYKVTLSFLLINGLLVYSLLQLFRVDFLHSKYNMDQLVVIAGIWSVVIILRTLKAPLSTATQALGDFKELFKIYAVCAVLGLGLTISLILLFGIEVSLFGVVIAESIALVMLLLQFRKKKGRLFRWKQ